MRWWELEGTEGMGSMEEKWVVLDEHFHGLLLFRKFLHRHDARVGVGRAENGRSKHDS